MRPRGPSRPRRGRPAAAAATLALATLAVTGCGGGSPHKLLHQGDDTSHTATVGGAATAGDADAAARLGAPTIVTRNTSRLAGGDSVADAAGAALAVFPSQAPGTHPTVATVAPTGNWEAALASSVLMAAPLHAPVLLSGNDSLPPATSGALTTLAPTGAGDANGAQVIRVGGVPVPPSGLRATAISGRGPYGLAAAIDRFQSAAAGRASPDVVIASTADPRYAMPAAGWAAESGDPILYVSRTSVPQATRQALQAHGRPNIYLLGPQSVADQSVAQTLRGYGTVKRISAPDPESSSTVFAAYRDPACTPGQACAHVPGSFGWALRSPGHGYTLLNASRTLDAAASAALSGSGDYGPQLLVDDPSHLPKPVLNYFLDYATPGYAEGGPTSPVYNHGWVIGDDGAIGASVQSELDNLLQAVPTSGK